MKNILNIIAVFALSITAIPALSVYGCQTEKISDIGDKSISMTEYKPDINFFKILDINTGNIMEIPIKDYIIGAVCAEMPASFDEEALKAQAIASHTYALYQKNHSDIEKGQADFSNDSTKYQAFFTNDEIRKYYGDKYDEYYKKVSEAVDAVYDTILIYENEPIVAAFHSMSSGTTESAKNIWGYDIPYLVPCDSSSDIENPDYKEEYIFTTDEIRSRLSVEYPDITFSDNYNEWFNIEKYSQSGTVLVLNAGNKQISGTDLRNILSLKSAVFEIEYTEDEKFKIITKGYGHGVGMSQYGAENMALNGETYDKILEHYYPGTVLSTYIN